MTSSTTTFDQLLDSINQLSDKFEKEIQDSLQQSVSWFRQESENVRKRMHLSNEGTSIVADVVSPSSPSSSSVVIAADQSDILSMSYHELQKKCGELKLPAKGSTAVLQERLLKYFADLNNKSNSSADTTTTTTTATQFEQKTTSKVEEEDNTQEEDDFLEKHKKIEEEKEREAERRRQRKAEEEEVERIRQLKQKQEEEEEERKRRELIALQEKERQEKVRMEEEKERQRLLELKKQQDEEEERKRIEAVAAAAATNAQGPKASELKKRYLKYFTGGTGGNKDNTLSSSSSSLLTDPTSPFIPSNSSNNQENIPGDQNPPSSSSRLPEPIPNDPHPNTPERPSEYRLSDDEIESPVSDDDNVPSWAKGEELRRAIKIQFGSGIDPSTIFPENPHTNFPLEEIFRGKVIKPRPRGSSGTWTKDALTSDEIAQNADLSLH